MKAVPRPQGMSVFWRTDNSFPFQVKLTVTGLPVQVVKVALCKQLHLWSERARKSAFGNSLEDIFPPRFFLLQFEVLLIQSTCYAQAGKSLPSWLDVLPIGPLLIQHTKQNQQTVNQCETPHGSLLTQAMQEPGLCHSVIGRYVLLGTDLCLYQEEEILTEFNT